QRRDIEQSDIAFTALDRADVGPMQAYPVRKLLLRQPRRPAGTTNPTPKLAKDLVIAHTCNFRPLTTIGLQTISIIWRRSKVTEEDADGQATQPPRTEAGREEDASSAASNEVHNPRQARTTSG